MKNRSKMIILVGLLLITNIVTVAFLMRETFYSRVLWPQVARGIIAKAAHLQARSDTRAGKLRLYEVSRKEEAEHKFTGRKKGEFEIWKWPHMTDLGFPDKFVSEKFVKYYNAKSKELRQKHAQDNNLKQSEKPEEDN